MKKCLNCEFENPVEAKFCISCGNEFILEKTKEKQSKKDFFAAGILLLAFFIIILTGIFIIYKKFIYIIPFETKKYSLNNIILTYQSPTYVEDYTFISLEENEIRGLIYQQIMKKEKKYIFSLNSKATTPLDELEDYLKCDFNDNNCKFTFYNFFEKMYEEKNVVNSNMDNFKELKEDIYFAKYNLIDEDHNSPIMYILISKKNNAISSIESRRVALLEDTNIDTDFEILELLKTIEFNTLVSDKNKLHENEFELHRKLKCSEHGSVESEYLGNKKVLDGEWRLISDSEESSYIFNNGEYYWYKSYKDTSDNYWYGTYEEYNGYDALEKLGITRKEMYKITKYNPDDVHAIIMTPKKMIMDGVDKSSTIINNEENNKYLFVIDNPMKNKLEGKISRAKSYNSQHHYLKVKD